MVPYLFPPKCQRQYVKGRHNVWQYHLCPWGKYTSKLAQSWHICFMTLMLASLSISWHVLSLASVAQTVYIWGQINARASCVLIAIKLSYHTLAFWGMLEAASFYFSQVTSNSKTSLWLDGNSCGLFCQLWIFMAFEMARFKLKPKHLKNLPKPWPY